METPEPPPVSPVGAMDRRSREHWLVLGFSVAGPFVLAVFAWFVRPDPRGFGTHEALGFPPCMPMKLWDLPCPGCGVTTSVALATHGELLASFVNQPFGFAVALLMAIAAVWAPLAHLRGRDLWGDVCRLAWGRVGAAGAALVIGAWVWKIWLVRHP